MVSTPTSDYTRYISVVTDQKKKDGSKLDFSKLLGVWAQGPDGMGQSFAQAVFGGSLPVGGIAVPMGNLSPADRKELVQQVKRDKVYQMSFNNVEKKRVNGRLQYTYNVTVPPSGYIAMMKRYAQLSGLHGLDQLNPDDYKKSNPFKLTITIDVRSHRVIKVASLDEGSEQTYTNYGVPVQITVPEKFITTQKLQQLLTEAQQ